jgi:ribosome-associated protein
MKSCYNQQSENKFFQHDMQKESKELKIIIRALEDIQAKDIITIDVTDKTSVTDYMIICSGRASRHVKAIADHLISIVKSHGMQVLHTTGMSNGEWVLLDLGDFIIHIMLPDCRSHYNIEGLWHRDDIQTNKAVNQ